MLTLERLVTLNRLNDAGLDVGLTCEYDMSRLNDVCSLLGREQIDPGRFAVYPAIQCALLEHPGFLTLCRELSEKGVEDCQIESWLNAEEQTGCLLMEHTTAQLLPAFQADLPSMTAAQEYLLYFLGCGLSDTQLEIVQANLRYACGSKQEVFLGAMDEAQRALFLHPFLREYLFRSEMAKTLPLLAASGPLTDFLDWLYATGLHLSLDADALRLLAALSEDAYALFHETFRTLDGDPHRMERFLARWLENGGHAGDLKSFLRAAAKCIPEELDAALNTRLSYLNLLYSGALDGIPFEKAPQHALPLLAHALANRQKVFLRLVAQHFDLLQGLKPGCMLFSRAFFTRTALNALTLKDLRACAEDCGDRNACAAIDALDTRIYTFEELHALWGAPVRYAELYRLLSVSRTDDRLLVLRQLLKRRLLPKGICDDGLKSLAARLSQKPLFQWRDQDFSHIQGLTARQCVLLLCVYDRIARFLPDISTEPEASFAIRQADGLAGYATWADVLGDIELLDSAWVRLRSTLDLDDAFVEENRRNIVPFLLREGASIAMSYQSCLGNPEGFHRIVRALLMGRYQELKYFQDDLNREISLPIAEVQKQRWMENISLMQGDFEISERDDFFTVMRIGEIPQRTCLCYKDGAYRECLLACFDSNKKFLFATLNGKPVARAMLRLTKGRSTAKSNPALEFADLRMTSGDANSNVAAQGEELVLFLETPYTNGLDEAQAQQVRELFVRLARQKAAQLGALPVLSACYMNAASSRGFTAMQYSLYISRSKAGKQYLDSLGGANGASNEGNYRCGRFLLPAQANE